MKTFRVAVVVAVVLTFMFIQESSAVAVPLKEVPVEKVEEVKEVEEVVKALSEDIPAEESSESAVDSLLMMDEGQKESRFRCIYCWGCRRLCCTSPRNTSCGACCRR